MAWGKKESKFERTFNGKKMIFFFELFFASVPSRCQVFSITHHHRPWIWFFRRIFETVKNIPLTPASLPRIHLATKSVRIFSVDGAKCSFLFLSIWHLLRPKIMASSQSYDVRSTWTLQHLSVRSMSIFRQNKERTFGENFLGEAVFVIGVRTMWMLAIRLHVFANIPLFHTYFHRYGTVFVRCSVSSNVYSEQCGEFAFGVNMNPSCHHGYETRETSSSWITHYKKCAFQMSYSTSDESGENWERQLIHYAPFYRIVFGWESNTIHPSTPAMLHLKRKMYEDSYKIG